jgi:hypothetical protein
MTVKKFKHNPPIAYVAHAITGPAIEGETTWQNHLATVHALGEIVAKAGFAPIVPIRYHDVPWKSALAVDRSLVETADVVVIHTSRFTAESRGVERERRWAKAAGIPIVRQDPDLPEYLGNLARG